MSDATMTATAPDVQAARAACLIAARVLWMAMDAVDQAKEAEHAARTTWERAVEFYDAIKVKEVPQ